MPFWKCNISAENLFQSEASVNVFQGTILHLKQVKKIITAGVSMLQEIKVVTKKQPSFRYTLVP